MVFVVISHPSASGVRRFDETFEQRVSVDLGVMRRRNDLMNSRVDARVEAVNDHAMAQQHRAKQRVSSSDP